MSTTPEQKDKELYTIPEERKSQIESKNDSFAHSRKHKDI